MYTIILLIMLHIIGDSALLGQKLRKQKINSFWYLLKHVAIYTAVFLVLSPLILHLTIYQGIVFSLINAVLHIIVDYVFTKIKLVYWIKDIYSGVAVTSIVEHLLHVGMLIGTFYLLYPEIARFDLIIEDLKLMLS